jgi:hypothetical protein
LGKGKKKSMRPPFKDKTIKKRQESVPKTTDLGLKGASNGIGDYLSVVPKKAFAQP